ncbi:MAG: BrxA/BrxB family bacilliredoxin [Gemmatimonadales bacterium]
MRYSPLLVQPMREDLTRVGFEELRTPDDVDRVMAQRQGTLLVVVNSVCGCSAGRARPGVIRAVSHSVLPDRLVTVFAGMETEATERARSYFDGYPPSSPAIALFKDGQLVHMMERKDIEYREADEIAAQLKAAFDVHCS